MYYLGLIFVPAHIMNYTIDLFVLIFAYLSFMSGGEDWCVCADDFELLISVDTERLIATHYGDLEFNAAVK